MDLKSKDKKINKINKIKDQEVQSQNGIDVYLKMMTYFFLKNKIYLFFLIIFKR